MMTMVCLKEDGKYDNHALIISNFFIICTILAILAFLMHFSRKMQYFLIKERAPILALAQSMLFLMAIVIPYGIEITTYMGHEWDSGRISIARRLVKAGYITCKLLCYLVFVLRYH